MNDFDDLFGIVEYGFHFGGDSGEFSDEAGYHPWRQMIDGTLAYILFLSILTISSLSSFQIPSLPFPFILLLTRVDL